MPETLYLFVTSKRPDQYLNPILHCLQYTHISKVVFLNDITNVGKGISAREVHDNVQSLLSSLAQGRYKYFIGEQANKEVDLLTFYSSATELATIKEKYRLLRERPIEWAYKDIEYVDLKEELTKIHKGEPESMFDVSAVNKSYLGDIIAISIIEGIRKIYTFDLNRSVDFDHPWKSLFHELKYGDEGPKGYKYENISKRPIYDKCSNSLLIRRPPLKFSLIVAPISLFVLIGINFYFGTTNVVSQIFTGLATIASLLSLYYVFFPPRS